MPNSDNARREIFGVLHTARGYTKAKEFANEVIGIGAAYWSSIVNDAPIPAERRARIVEDFRRHFKSFEFKDEYLDLDSSEQFAELFVKEDSYHALRKAIIDKYKKKPLPDMSGKKHPLDKCFGYFLGLYTCRDPDDKNRRAVAYDGFLIEPIENEYRMARVIQLTDPVATGKSSIGMIRARSDTIEIHINFGNDEDPDATYMASKPRGDRINSILAISVDIKIDFHKVVARPALFIRVEKSDIPGFTRILDYDTPVYKAVEQLFDRYVNRAEKFEMEIHYQLDENGEDLIKDALLALRQEAKSMPPAEG